MSQNPHIQLSIILPSHNDGAAIPPAIRTIRKYCPKRTEIIIIIDGSTDRSEDIMKKLQHHNKLLRSIHHRICMGKGASVQDGIMAARGKIIAFTDVDLVIHPSHLHEAYKMMQLDRTLDIVIGRRTKYHTRPVRKILHVLFRLANILLFGFPFWDTQAGLKMFRSVPAKQLFFALKTRGYAFDVEILFRARAMGMNIGQIPVIQSYRKYSSMSLQKIIGMGIDIVKILCQSVQQSWSHSGRPSSNRPVLQLHSRLAWNNRA